MTSSRPDAGPTERWALFGLASAAVSGRVPPDLGIALADSAPHALAAEAQRLQIHTAIGPVLDRHPDLGAALPPDLVLFFRAMHAANRARLAEGLAQLRTIGTALAAGGIPALVLKGGGDMLSPLHRDPALRYVGDLDILVPPDRAGETLAALRGMGAVPLSPPAHATSRFDWRGQRLPRHHLPRLVRPGWTFPVEIHVRAGPGALATALDPVAMLRDGVPTAIPGLSVGSSEDRACHLILHAARHEGRVALRAWIDWVSLRRMCDRASVADRLGRAGHGRAFGPFEVMADRLDAAGAPPMPHHDRAALHAALAALGPSESRSIADIVRFLYRRGRGLALSPAYRRHIAARLLERRLLRDITGRHGADR